MNVLPEVRRFQVGHEVDSRAGELDEVIMVVVKTMKTRGISRVYEMVLDGHLRALVV
jgi:hypothetical protein